MGQLFDEYPALLVLPEILLMIVLVIGIIGWAQARGKRGPRHDKPGDQGQPTRHDRNE